MFMSKESSRKRAVRVVSKGLFMALMAGTIAACSNDFARISEGDYTSATASQRAFLRQAPKQSMPVMPSRSAAPLPVMQSAIQPVMQQPVYQQPVMAAASNPATRPDPRIAAAAVYRPTPVNLANNQYFQQQAVAVQQPQSQPVYAGNKAYDPINTASSLATGQSGWTRVGGTTIVIAPGDTLATLSRRYGVPERAIVDANGMRGPQDVVAGRYLTIPTYVHASGQQARVQAQPQMQPQPQMARAVPVQTVVPQAFPQQPKYVQPKVIQAKVSVPATNYVQPVGFANSPKPARKPVMRRVAAAQPARVAQKQFQKPAVDYTRPARTVARTTTRPASGASYQVVSGDTLYGVARRNGVTVESIRAANGMGQSNNIRLGQLLVIPGANSAVAQAANFAQPKRNQTVTTTASIPARRPAVKVVQPRTQPTAFNPPKAQPKRQTRTEQTAQSGKLAFRWPVRGRVISTFGEKTNGERNDGINLAVPEGTPVKAAEDGVVIYSGNELKSYGNLVLVRHSNGWVTAYAHNRALNVRRGEQVRRGQEIASAGATGSVSTPQLRFELRKGSTPVNPLDHLGGV